jgi:hypothetical protein
MKKSSTIKKAQMGAGIPKSNKPAPKPKKTSPIPAGVPMPKAAKAKNGKSLGMKSVKAGYDNNPAITRADIISAAKKKAKYGVKVADKKPISKAQLGKEVMKEYDLPEVTKKAKSLRPMEIALGDDRKMSIDTVGYKSGNYRRPDSPGMRDETFNYTISDKKGNIVSKSRLQSEPGQSRVDIVDKMVKGLESGKLKRPTFKSGGKITAKKTIAKKGTSVKKAMGKCKMGC